MLKKGQGLSTITFLASHKSVSIFSQQEFYNLQDQIHAKNMPYFLHKRPILLQCPTKVFALRSIESYSAGPDLIVYVKYSCRAMPGTSAITCADFTLTKHTLSVVIVNAKCFNLVSHFTTIKWPSKNRQSKVVNSY